MGGCPLLSPDKSMRLQFFSGMCKRGLSPIVQSSNKKSIFAGIGIAYMQGLSESIYSNLLYEDRWLMMADGLLNTIKVSLWSILLATLFGAILCAIRMKTRNWVRGCVRLYVDLMRAIPLLVLLLLLFYVILADSLLSPLWIAIVCFTL